VKAGGKGFSWGTLATAAMAALFAGALLGGVFGSRRRRVPTVSVYAAVKRRMDHNEAEPRR
jgi:hypothetical protein